MDEAAHLISWLDHNRKTMEIPMRILVFVSKISKKNFFYFFWKIKKLPKLIKKCLNSLRQSEFANWNLFLFIFCEKLRATTRQWMTVIKCAVRWEIKLLLIVSAMPLNNI
jgi:hypothetical protein